MTRPRARRRVGIAIAAAVATLVLVATSLALASPSPNAGARPTHKPKPTATIGVTPAPTVAPTPAPTLPPVPAFSHVFVILMENEESSSIIGNSAAPYINGLANQYGWASNYTAVAHPSEPNYLALWSGSTQGVVDDAIYNFSSGTTLADQIEAAGKSWHVGAQNVPISSCFTGASSPGGEDGTGTSWTYVRKHEPAISWTSVSGNSTRCTRITDFKNFDPTVGNFWFLVPNLCNDMHDCGIAVGDTFLKNWMPAILNSPAFADRGVIFLTWDEGTTQTGGGGKIVTIVISPLGKTAFVSATAHDHYSLLRTIQSGLGLGCLLNSCTANDLREFFR
jgi:hypothetical protein